MNSSTSRDHQLILDTMSHVRDQLQQDTTGHDWLHTERVWRMAKILAEKEQADSTIAQLAALLHDIRDWKLHKKEHGSSDYARQWLTSRGTEPELIGGVCDVIEAISFSGEATQENPPNREAAVVLDADRLDAIGAIGIARAFAYGGSVGRPIHDPDLLPRPGMDRQAYRQHVGTTVNHFHEKLLLLRDRMQTDTGRRIAENRHHFMTEFLDQFHREWHSQDLPGN